MYIPCKDCEEREIGCHGHCKRYKAFRAELDRLHKKEKEERSANRYQMDSIEDSMKRGRMGKWKK